MRVSLRWTSFLPAIGAGFLLLLSSQSLSPQSTPPSGQQQPQAQQGQQQSGQQSGQQAGQAPAPAPPSLGEARRHYKQAEKKYNEEVKKSGADSPQAQAAKKERDSALDAYNAARDADLKAREGAKATATTPHTDPDVEKARHDLREAKIKEREAKANAAKDPSQKNLDEVQRTNAERRQAEETYRKLLEEAKSKSKAKSGGVETMPMNPVQPQTAPPPPPPPEMTPDALSACTCSDAACPGHAADHPSCGPTAATGRGCTCSH